MKRLFLSLFALAALLALCACAPPEEKDDSVRVMVTENAGITIVGQNPQDVPAGSDATFTVKVNSGYLFESVSVGEYDPDTETLTVSDVTHRTRVKFEMENLGYSTDTSYTYKFHNESGRDTTSVTPSRNVSAGTLITVTAGDASRKFVGWSFGESYENGGYIVSAERTYTFRLSPDVVTAGTLEVYPNYTDSNVYYYDANGGGIDTSSKNMAPNDYYTATVDGNRVKVVMLEKYYSFAECASTFWDDGTFIRDGYVLTEYNTKADGTGEAYSLGSKYYTESSGATGVLYCIWEKEEAKESFTVSDTVSMPKPSEATHASRWYQSGVEILSYNGDADKVVIPELIDGKPVISIAAGALTDKNMSTLVIPKTVQRIEDGAVVGCSSLETIYFPNSVYYMSDDALDEASYSGFHTLIVNATQAPRNTTTSDGGFAVKLCKLLAAEDEKKVIVISGSSSYQGLASEYMEALFEGEYTVVNFGTTRPRPGAFYLEALSHYTDEDDIFVYAPENSAFMFGEQTLNWRFLYDLEGMNNLFRYVDIANYKNYFSSFSQLNRETVTKKPELKYEQICDGKYTDKNGDYQNSKRDGYAGTATYVDTYFVTLNERVKSIYDYNWNDVPNQTAHKDYTDESDETWTSITRPELVAQMNMAIGKAQASGARVYFGFAPVDSAELVEAARSTEWLAAYDELIATIYSFDGVLGSCADYIYNTVYMYDCAYHVNNYGRAYRTYRLYTDICEALGITDVNGIYSVGTDFDGTLFEDGSDGTPISKVDFLEGGE